MLELVEIGRRPLDAYRGITPDDVIEELIAAAAPLRGARVLHLNATPYGGGVSELLRSVVPLYNDLGLISDWRIIRGNEQFFDVTKAMHNGLQGGKRELTTEEEAHYLEQSRLNAEAFTEEYDFVFVHDPQPAAILPFRGKGDAQWIWRCHIDTAAPNPQIWNFLRPFLAEYDAAIFTMDEFVPPDLPVQHVEIIPPAIDPISPKNLELPVDTARHVIEWLGVRIDRPLLTQISRFDPWKDPVGVIEAYRKVRAEIPDLQLVLAGSLAMDDPEGWNIYNEIREASHHDPKIHCFTNLLGVGNIEVNAFQALSDVVVQKSIQEGFGLVVAETLLKGTPMVASRCGGIPLQMADGAGGFLVDGIDECAEGILKLFRDPELAQDLAKQGQERVRQHFLIPRLVLNHFNLMQDLAAKQPLLPRSHWMHRDPVCGMALGDSPEFAVAEDGIRYGFCSERCRTRFLEDPNRFLLAA